MKQNKLRITEIFRSIQGESDTIGWPTVFVRLTGCPLRCQYCDTAYAFSGGHHLSLDEVLSQVAELKVSHVCITGGEPLAQPGCLPLLTALCEKGYQVSLETSGARSIEAVDSRVMIVMDLKTPDSKESDKNLMENLKFLKPRDQIKFVLCSRADYDWACHMLTAYQLPAICQVLFSPSFQELNATMLANWIVEDSLPVRFQLQLHKILWNDTPGH